LGALPGAPHWGRGRAADIAQKGLAVGCAMGAGAGRRAAPGDPANTHPHRPTAQHATAPANLAI